MYCKFTRNLVQYFDFTLAFHFDKMHLLFYLIAFISSWVQATTEDPNIHVKGDDFIFLSTWNPSNFGIYISAIDPVNRSSFEFSPVPIKPPPHYPSALVYDPIDSAIYWFEYDIDSFSYFIKRSYINGTTEKVLDIEGDVYDAEFDVMERRLYFSISETIYEINVDDPGIKTHLNTSGGLVPSIDLDTVNRYIYWINNRDNSEINRQQLNDIDSDHQQVLIITERYARGLALSVDVGKMYWCEMEAIVEAGLDGSNRRVIINTRNQPYDSALHGHYLYWSDDECINYVNIQVGLQSYQKCVLTELNGVTSLITYGDNVKEISKTGSSTSTEQIATTNTAITAARTKYGSSRRVIGFTALGVVIILTILGLSVIFFCKMRTKKSIKTKVTYKVAQTSESQIYEVIKGEPKLHMHIESVKTEAEYHVYDNPIDSKHTEPLETKSEHQTYIESIKIKPEHQTYLELIETRAEHQVHPKPIETKSEEQTYLEPIGNKPEHQTYPEPVEANTDDRAYKQRVYVN